MFESSQGHSVLHFHTRKLLQIKKTALVTGGARRLGKHICMGLAEAGFDIAFTYNSSNDAIVDSTCTELKQLGAEAYPLRCDVRDLDQVRNAVSMTNERFNSIDVLVNNAAIFRRIDLFEITGEDFDNFINTNLRSVLFFSKHVAQSMLANKNKPGRIINISSMGAFENWTGFIPYGVSKAGVVKLSALLAKRLAPEVLVNSIAPGTIMIEDDDNENVDMNEVKRYPVKRFGKTNDIVSLVKYLAVENEFITGQTIRVDGGKEL